MSCPVVCEFPDTSSSVTQKGSAFFIVLIAVVLFATLTYAISRMESGTNGLSTERLHVSATEVIDQGNKFADAVAKMRLQGISATTLSFSNSSVAGYNNAACTTNNCLFFANEGGGFEWQSPPPSVNSGEDWGFSGDVSIKNIGTSAAELVALLPDLSLDVCMAINQLLGATAGTAPSSIAATAADKFTGAYNGTPSVVTAADLDGQKSGCYKATSLTGTAISGGPFAQKYVYYQVLVAQ